MRGHVAKHVPGVVFLVRFNTDYWLLFELHALLLATRSYALLMSMVLLQSKSPLHWGLVPYSRKFSLGPNFRDFRNP